VKIVIPTLGRINEQHTYNALPQKYKDEVKFIVQPHEYDEMASIYGEQVLCLPEGINKIAATRNWIMHEFKDYRYMCFDDDMQGFVIKEPYILDGKEKWKSRNFEESDFDDWFNHVEKWMDEGYVHGAMLPATIKPVSGRWPYQANFRIVTNCFWDGPNLPIDKINWTRVESGEDFDVALQLLNMGYPNMVSTKWMVSPSATNAKGGCSEWRDVEYHNKYQRELAKLWPGIINLKETTVKSGPWKGEKKLNVTIQWKKAYKSCVEKKGTLNEFFV
jgi:hypothetical protein